MMMEFGNSSSKGWSCYASDDRFDKPVKSSGQASKLSLSIMIATATSFLLFGQLVMAQSDSPVGRLTQGLSERIEFDVNSFNVIGDNPLSAAKTKAILAPFIGADRGIEILRMPPMRLKK